MIVIIPEVNETNIVIAVSAGALAVQGK